MAEVKLIYDPEEDVLCFVYNRTRIEGVRHFMEVDADDATWGASLGDFEEDRWSWSASIMAGICCVRERIAVGHEWMPQAIVTIGPNEIGRFKKVFNKLLRERGELKRRGK